MYRTKSFFFIPGQFALRYKLKKKVRSLQNFPQNFPQNGSNIAGPLGGPEGPQWYSLPQELEKAREAGYFSSIYIYIDLDFFFNSYFYKYLINSILNTLFKEIQVLCYILQVEYNTF